MWLHPVSVKKNVQKYILPKLCLTPEIKSKYFRTGECVGIGQTTVLLFVVLVDGHFCTYGNRLTRLTAEIGKMVLKTVKIIFTVRISEWSRRY